MDARVKESHLDPVTLEVIRNALPAISNEMAVDLQRTSYNMIIYEVRDFCTALVLPNGDLVSQNVGGVSHFIADLGVMITDAMQRYEKEGFQPGDVLISNHQRVAGQHLNNICIHMPYFYKGELLMFAIVRAHWIDVGGSSTGFGAGLTVADPWLEGLQLDQLCTAPMQSHARRYRKPLWRQCIHARGHHHASIGNGSRQRLGQILQGRRRSAIARRGRAVVDKNKLSGRQVTPWAAAAVGRIGRAQCRLARAYKSTRAPSGQGAGQWLAITFIVNDVTHITARRPSRTGDHLAHGIGAPLRQSHCGHVG